MSNIIDFEKHKKARDQRKQAEVDFNISLLLSAPNLSNSDIQNILSEIENSNETT